MSKTIDLRGAAKGAYLGGLAAGLLSVGLYLLGTMAGATFRPIDPAAMGGLEVLPAYQPIVVCLLAATVSLGVLALLRKLAGDHKAWTIYLGVAAVVFVLEAIGPLHFFDDTMTIVFLELMHIPATIGIVGGIHKYGRR